MSRTNRNLITQTNHREARKGRENARTAWEGKTRTHGRGGNMLMAKPWRYRFWDERMPSGRRKSSGTHRDSERRSAKRSERQKINYED